MSQNSPSTYYATVRTRVLWAKSHEFQVGTEFYSEHVPVYFLWLVQEGQLNVNSSAGTWEVKQNEIFLGTPCRNRMVTAPIGAKWLSLGVRVSTPQEMDLLEREIPLVITASQNKREQLKALLSSLVSASDDPEAGSLLLREGIALAIVGWYFSVVQRNESSLLATRNFPAWLQETLRRIQEEPSLRVEELASAVHFSPAQFRRNFAEHIGMSPRAYLHQQRLNQARFLVEVSEDPLPIIAEKSGWGNATHFSRMFKQHFGVRPLEWRRAARDVL